MRPRPLLYVVDTPGPVRHPSAAQLDWDLRQSLETCCAVHDDDMAAAVACALPDRVWVKRDRAHGRATWSTWSCAPDFAAMVVADLRGFDEDPAEFLGRPADYGRPVPEAVAAVLADAGWSERLPTA